MEQHEITGASRRQRPERYASATIASVLIALMSFAVFVALKYLCPALGDSPAIALWLSLAGGYVVAPILGLLAVTAVREGRSLRIPDGSSAISDEALRTARRFLIAALLLAVLSAWPATCCAVFYRSLPQPPLPIWLGVWLVLLALTASALGCSALGLSHGHGRKPLTAKAVAVVTFNLVAAVATFSMTSPGSYLVQRATYACRTASFSGDSASLKRTVIVPTLDTPCPPQKNVIWCSSFQLAWNEIRDKVIGAPLEVAGAEEVAARLNAAQESDSDLESKSYYVAGGWTKDDICDKIRKDMAAKFPVQVLPDLGARGDGILAYSYLTASVPFKYPFRQLTKGLAFTDSAGVEARVAGFGLWEAHRPQYEKIREQVEVLYAKYRDRRRSWELEEYALDLCKYSEPYQVVVAMVAPRGSLAETLEYIRLRTEEFHRQTDSETVRHLEKQDQVQVPQMFWKIDHCFHELIGRVVGNVDLPIVEAKQTMEFRLDRSGATLESAVMVMLAASPRYFTFDRPFLVYLQKRGAEHPFFVMWVDNAELLTRK